MYTLVLTPKFIKDFQKLVKNNSKLAKKVDEKTRLLCSSPKHPSLRLHKLVGGLKTNWSISVNMSLRITFHIENNKIILHRIGTHEQVYS